MDTVYIITPIIHLYINISTYRYTVQIYYIIIIFVIITSAALASSFILSNLVPIHLSMYVCLSAITPNAKAARAADARRRYALVGHVEPTATVKTQHKFKLYKGYYNYSDNNNIAIFRLMMTPMIMK